MTDNEADAQLAAIHECAHAIGAFIVGVEIHSLWIEVEQESVSEKIEYCGRIEFTHFGDSVRDGNFKANTFLALCGPTCEWLFRRRRENVDLLTGFREDNPWGWQSDIQEAQHSLGQSGAEEYASGIESASRVLNLAMSLSTWITDEDICAVDFIAKRLLASNECYVVGEEIADWMKELGTRPFEAAWSSFQAML